MQKAQDPFKKLGLLKDIYISKNAYSSGYSSEDLNETYNIGIDILKELKNLRNSQSKTIEYLSENALGSQVNNNYILLETWLLQSISNCPTFVYAYNFMGQKVNRHEGSVVFEVMIISDLDLYELLVAEMDEENSHVSNNYVKGILSLKQIALIHIYNNQRITRENANEIAKKYGYFSKYSGEKLYQNFSHFSSRANRRAIPDPFSRKLLQNKIDLFESLFEHLTESKKEQIIDEIKLLYVKLKTDRD